MRAWLEISRAALAANARAIGRLTGPARLCAVVKSNAYGHGLLSTARAISASGVPGLGFGVFGAAEGLVLRSGGIAEPILVVGPVTDDELPDAVAADLELGLLDEADAVRFGRQRATVHVKVETGTGRFGLSPKAAAAAVTRLHELGSRVAGMYSHLADAEELDAAFAREQLARLIDVAGMANSALEAAGYSQPTTSHSSPLQGSQPSRMPLHIAASAAALMWPELRLDMVRCGIAMYGAWPSQSVRERMREIAPTFVLERAMRFFAPIVHVFAIASGETVGYGCEFRAERASRIAVLPVGYADGIPRAAGNGTFRVKVRNGYAPVVGRICMNACMIDVTDCTPAPVRGDTAELDLEDLATSAGTINYEILARLSPELDRRYA